MEVAQRATLKHFHEEGHHPAVARAGYTCAQYLDRAIPTPRFAATLTSSALTIAGRKADGRLYWETYVHRETATARAAHQAVPATATLGDQDSINNIGRSLGFSDETTNELIADIVLTLTVGYPYRSASQHHLSLTEVLAQITADDLTELLVDSALATLSRAQQTASPRRPGPETH
ncbi:hypothetical protein ABZ626_03515 [Streptomyces longispororuber]|uniref:hypothetical protein n=1 Tax=Streptomyces longispororuber TaxID=68230 RepID=UPI0033D696BE